MTIHVDLIAGLPGEDYQSFIRSFNETYELWADEIQLGFLKELKGTLISETKEEHGYQFTSRPPYQVIKTIYVSASELDELKAVEAIVDKYHNSGDFKRSLAYLFKNNNWNRTRLSLRSAVSLKVKTSVPCNPGRSLRRSIWRWEERTKSFFT